MTTETQALAGLTIMMHEELNSISKLPIFIALCLAFSTVPWMLKFPKNFIINYFSFLSFYSEPAPGGLCGPSGHVDYRLDADTHPALCIDTKFATFYDDAFSLSPETGEILIHVVDVVSGETLIVFMFILFTFLFRVRSNLLVHTS